MTLVDDHINAESVNDRAKLLLHRIIARRLALRLDIVDVARCQMKASVSRPEYVREWVEILDLNPTEIRQLITSRTDKMVRLRQSSPLTQADFQDRDFRRRVWRLARKGFRRKGASEVPASKAS